MIAFAPSDEQQAILEQVHVFAAAELRPAARACEAAGCTIPVLVERAHALGLHLLEVPEALGGLGLGMLTRVLVDEELAWGDPGIAAALGGPGMAGYAILECGSPTQAEEMLRSFGANPRRAAALALAEDIPGFESSAVALQAERDGDTWHLRGRKFPVTPISADLVVVVAAGPELFVLRRDTKGLEFGVSQALLGLNAASSGELVVDCRVGEDARLGTPARFARTLVRTKLTTAARAVGLARAAFEYAAQYATQRRAFGHSLAEHQVPAFMVADMGIGIEAARALLWRAAWRFDREPDESAAEVAMALAAALEVAMMVSNHAVQLLGGHGYMRDHPVEKWMRDAKALALGWGTLQTAHREIASAVLAI